jgi:hypothetical protein
VAGSSLQDIAAIAEIIGVLTIVTGLVFGLFQLRAHRIQQRNAVATSLSKTFYNTDFAKSVVLLHQLPDGAGADAINEAGPEFLEAAVVVCTSFETMGLLVYKRIAPFDLVMDLAGGMCRSMYRKLEQWILERRETQGQPSWAEWFEWLATQADKHKDEQTLSRNDVSKWRPR